MSNESQINLINEYSIKYSIPIIIILKFNKQGGKK